MTDETKQRTFFPTDPPENLPELGNDRERSISNNLAASLCLIASVLLMVLMGAVYMKDSRAFRDELRVKANEYIHRLSGVLSIAIWNYDLGHIRWIGEEYSRDEAVYYLCIQDRAGGIFYTYGGLRDGEAHEFRRESVTYGGEVLGTVSIALSMSAYKASLDRLLSLTIVLGGGAIFTILFSTGVVLRVLLRRPLAEFREGMDRLADGDFSSPLGAGQYRELAGIAHRFREMARTIQEREKAAAEANYRLTREVAERQRAVAVNQTLYDISTAVNASDGLDRLYAYIHEALGRIITAGNLFIALYHPESDALSFPYYRDEKDARPDMIRQVGQRNSLTYEVIRSGRPRLFRRADLEEMRDTDRPFIGTLCEVWIGAPLRTDERIIGAVVLQSYADPNCYTHEDLDVLASVSERIATAIAHKRSREALKESELRFKSLFDLSPQGIMLTESRTGRLVDVNDQFCRIIHRRREEIISLSLSRIGVWPEEEWERMAAVLAVRGEIQGGETVFTPREGETRHLLVFARPITIAHEDLALILFVDVTTGKRDMEEKRLLTEKLNRSRKMESLGMLVGGVAHDLNNILLGIVSYPDLLLEGLPPDHAMRRPLELIQKSGERAAAVVSDLLTLARGVASVKEVCDMNAIVGEYLESPEFQELRDRYPATECVLRLEEGMIPVRCSMIHVRKALMNLVSNAFEALLASGRIGIATFRRRTERPLHGHETIPPGHYAVLQVRDDGPGISEEDKAQIFEPFYSRKVMGRSGSGLGLTVVWNTAQDHGGYVDVSSRPGETVFELYFPLDPGTPVAPDEEGYRRDHSGQGERILVVDDDENQRVIACDMLLHLGYRPHAVDGGRAALRYLAEEVVDLVLLDMIMENGMNGRETYERIIEMRPGQRAVISSGYADTEDVRRVRELGAAVFLKKPYTLNQLGKAVRDAILEEIHDEDREAVCG